MKDGYFKATNVELHQIQTEILRMLIDFESELDISKFIADKYGKSPGIIRGYILKALEEAKSHETKCLEKQRSRQKSIIWKRFQRALRKFEDTDNPKMEKIALDWHARYLSLFPNGLVPEDEESSMNLNISFNKIEDEK